MTITTATISPNGGSVPPEPNNSNNNLAIILGICIPLGVISNILFYFSYWCYYLFRCD
jgi:hypothetical protein